MPRIVIKRDKHTFKVVETRRNVTIKPVKKTVKILGASKRGLPGEKGEKGDAGEGVASGGLAGQFLVKQTNSDYDTTWVSPAVLDSDKYFQQDFIASSIVSVNHGLNKYPSVTVHDSAGDEVEGEVDHTSVNALTVTFSAPFSGRVTCN